MSVGRKPLIFRLNENGNGPDILRQVFLERGWLQYDEDKHEESEWNIWWKTSRFRNSDYEYLFPWQRLNHYPKSTGITKKDCLVRNLKRMRGVHGAGVYNFSPLSFNLPNDYTRFVAEFGKLKAKVDSKTLTWICKPADMSRGRGIFIFRDIPELQYDCNAVVQRYVANPLCIGGYKFDIRIYVAVPSFHPLTIYVFQEGLVRFGTEKYDLNCLNNIFSHLTNTSINLHSPSYMKDKERIGPGCKWTLTQLRYYFHQNNMDDRLFWTRVINIIILTLLIQAPLVPKENNCFELYGFDILIDENFKPWLLEVNFSPALSADCQADVMVKKPLLHDLMDMMNFKDEDARRGSIIKPGLQKGTDRKRVVSGTADPNDRMTSAGRLSRRGSMQKMGSSLSSSKFRSVNSPVLEQTTLSYIEQDDIPTSRDKTDDKLCFGLPLVQPDDDQGSYCSSGRGSAGSEDGDRVDLCIPSIAGHDRVMSGYGIRTSATQIYTGLTPAIDRREGSFSQRYEKGSVTSFGNSDSAISSFSGSSDNSDRVSLSSNTAITSSNNKGLMQRKKSYTFRQASEISSEPSSNEAFSMQSSRTAGSPQLQRRTKQQSGTASNGNNTLKLKLHDRVPSRNFVSRSQSRIGENKLRRDMTQRSPSRTFVSRSVSRFGDLSARSETTELVRQNRSHLGMATIGKGQRDLYIGSEPVSSRTGFNSPRNLQKNIAKMFSVPFRKPVTKSCAPRVGDFFLVFPFNEGTSKCANGTLDAHAVIKETQKLLKEVKQDLEKNSSANRRSGHLPFGAQPGSERLWAPLKTLLEES